MYESHPLYHLGNRFRLVEVRTVAPNTALGRALSRSQAEPLLAELMSSGASAELRAAYAELTGTRESHRASDYVVLTWLLAQLRDFGGGARLCLVESASLSAAPAAAEVADTRAQRNLDRIIAELSKSDLIHRGSGYRIVRAQESASLPGRDQYEAVSEREAGVLLQQMIAEPTRSERHKALLGELASSNGQQQGNQALQLLLLRRIRVYERAQEAAPVLTPSQLRQKHFIAVQAVDAAEKPIAGVALELMLPDGSTKNIATDDEGVARLDLTQAGDVTIRLPNIDASSWQAVGGASAVPSGKKGPARTHAVKQCECLSKIAQKYGVADWKLIWDYADNASLRTKRKSPHVLYPGDRLVVPGIQVNEIVRAVDATHRIEVMTAASDVELAVRFKDSEGEALSGAYELRWDNESEPKLSGSLDGSGGIKEQIPIHVKELEVLLVESGQRYMLATSHLDPTEDESGAFLHSGVAARLSALGYLHSISDSATPESLLAAVLHFQREAIGQEQPTGELDAATCRKIEELYGV